MLTICGHKLSEFKVVLPDEPNPAEAEAGKILAECIEKVSGAAPNGEYGIYIGGSRDTEGIRYDGFKLSTDNDNLYLCGLLPRGTLYAVTDFTERYLGIRKYAPDTEKTVDVGDVSIPRNTVRVSNPFFELRANDSINHSSDPDFALWERVNAFCPDRKEHGGTVKNIGGCHTMEGLCPPSLYFKEHPEYYSFWEGRRIPAGNQFNSEENGQLCLTNPDVLRIVTENVLARLHANPDAKIVELSQNDNTRYCRCERCAAVDEEEGGPSGTLIRFVNAVAEAVEREFPNVLVQTFAYQYTRRAPKLTKPRHNVIIRYCTIEACFRHTLDDESCERNAGKFAEELAEWRKICDKISIWDYVTNYSCYLAPFPNFEVIPKNIRFFADNHVIHLFEEDTPGTASGDLGALKAYLIAKLMWNPYMSDEEYHAVMGEFLEAYFGKGWHCIREYMKLVEETTKNVHMGCFAKMDTGFLGSDPRSELYIPRPYQEPADESYLSALMPRIEEAKELWSKAAALAETPEEKMHIDRSRLSVDYLDLFCKGYKKDEMSSQEIESYEREVALYYGRKQKYAIHTNIWTARAGH